MIYNISCYICNVPLSAGNVCWACIVPSYHTVVHDFIPIFPRDNPEENGDGLARCGEVGVPAILGGDKHSDNSLETCFTASGMMREKGILTG